MISKWHWTIVQLSRQLWMRAVLFALLAAATALATLFFKELIPPDLSGKIGAHAVDKILNILASGMLVVTTFSLSVMVAAYSSATSSISPRATRLLMEDSTTQNVLATFVGSFLYSLIGITALNAGIYDEEGRVILFIVTLGVIVLIVATMLLWIEHLSHLGRVGETNDRIEKATLKAVLQRAKYPWLGGSPLDDPTLIPQQTQAIYSTEIGYVQYIDIAAISRWTEEAKARVYIVSVPGAYVYPKRVLAWIEADGEVDKQIIQSAFSIASERSFDQDPRFGFSVLTEVASRALSPAVNDPGTAIEILSRGVRIFYSWKEMDKQHDDSEAVVDHPRVYIPPVRLSELFDDFFTSIARDGAHMVEVQIRLHKALAALAQISEPFRQNAVRHSQAALARAEAVLTFEGDKQRLRELVKELELTPE